MPNKDRIGEQQLDELHAKLLGHLRARVGRYSSPPGIILEVLQASRDDDQTRAYVLYDYHVHHPTSSGSDTEDHVVVFAVATVREDRVDVETKIRETVSIHERHWGYYDRLELWNAVRERARGLIR